MIGGNNKGPNNARYKTTMCKHYNTPQGCSYGDKCQFAHGPQDLRTFSGQGGQNPMGDMNQQKNQKNPLNFKIVKCKNFEKDGTCKYGSHCTFAHGDADLRSKADNYTQMAPNMSMMNPNFMYDYSMMQQMGAMGLPPNFDMSQMAMVGNFDPNQMMMNMNPQMGMDMMMPNPQQGQPQGQPNNNTRGK